jgi:hypothetical protein
MAKVEVRYNYRLRVGARVPVGNDGVKPKVPAGTLAA